ncbi:flavodoxin domain-containing protein [Fimbriimonas ginsengisoli]|uniref:Flavodoxin/nitric oxide synthase n=1 Tax=Fimbriimonas ginsengisoli Gsoil 348 TaxID=661478 RepID=A0A068NV34_FIMGI|nr:flavodoxin domain-containing protein [Fimbriimonas ginsengisoli]AIE86605.1 flavodoxin/nitric oxide synthase [Fimbriimonas ginsengisoli Gsoil 348]
MKRIALVISTQYGQTAKIADRIKEILREAGHEPSVFLVSSKGDLGSVPIDRFDAAILGAPVYAGSFPKLLIEWAKLHGKTLGQIPTAFYSVSLNAADKRPEARKEDIRLLTQFLNQTGLKTRYTASLIGAIKYRQYGFLKRWLLKRICRAAGGPTDTSRDHELTDWTAVAAFAEEFSNSLAEARPKAFVR